MHSIILKTTKGFRKKMHLTINNQQRSGNIYIYLGQKHALKEESRYTKLHKISRKQITYDRNESKRINNYFEWEWSKYLNQ